MNERAPEAPSLADFYRDALEQISEVLRVERQDARLVAPQIADNALTAEEFGDLDP